MYIVIVIVIICRGRYAVAAHSRFISIYIRRRRVFGALRIHRRTIRAHIMPMGWRVRSGAVCNRVNTVVFAEITIAAAILIIMVCQSSIILN